jgi:hypothetical protein
MGFCLPKREKPSKRRRTLKRMKEESCSLHVEIRLENERERQLGNKVKESFGNQVQGFKREKARERGQSGQRQKERESAFFFSFSFYIFPARERERERDGGGDGFLIPSLRFP